MIKFIMTLAFLHSSSCLCSQSIKTGKCYTKTINDLEKVFDKMLYYPHLKGSDEELNLYLIGELNIESIAKSINDSIRIFEDSIRIKFIVSKNFQMSNLSVIGKNSILSSEIERALIKSSCRWIPGGTERYLPGWYNGMIYFKLSRNYKDVTVKVSTFSNRGF